MIPPLRKFGTSAGVSVTVSEISRRNLPAGSLPASRPLTSLLARVWLGRVTRDRAKLAALPAGILGLALPPPVRLLVLPAVLKRGMPFFAAPGIAIAATVATCRGLGRLLNRPGVAH